MNIHSPDTDGADRDLADLALRTKGGSPSGPVPDLWDIERFRQDGLSAERRSEVLSHLAHDPESFAMLRELEQAETQLERLGLGTSWRSRIAQSMHGIRFRLQEVVRLHSVDSGGFAWKRHALAAAVLTGALVVVVSSWTTATDPLGQIDALARQMSLAQVPPPEAWPWWQILQRRAHRPVGPSFGSRSTTGPTDRAELAPRRQPTPDSMEEQAFRIGAARAIEHLVGADRRWTPWVSTLPKGLPVCPESDAGCANRVAAGIAIGRWTTFIAWRCRFDGADDTEFWDDQDRLRLSLADTLDDTVPALAATLRNWPGEPTRTRLCNGVGVRLDATFSR